MKEKGKMAPEDLEKVRKLKQQTLRDLAKYMGGQDVLELREKLSPKPEPKPEVLAPEVPPDEELSPEMLLQALAAMGVGKKEDEVDGAAAVDPVVK